jgi:dihydrofolate synthase/folylpolyglutamate synthase
MSETSPPGEHDVTATLSSASSARRASTDARRAWFRRRLFAERRFAIELGLGRMRDALERRGHPERRAHAILVAGTNGKGTTACLLANILQAHDLRVGLYTSPHLVSLTERFRIDGVPVAYDEMSAIGASLLEEFGDEDGPAGFALTFFEITTMMATEIFAHSDVDVAIYEVGLGGRLDATNAIEPTLSVVTTLGYDHTDYLGDDLASIAGEKLGIARPDVPLVVGRQEYAEADEALDAQTAPLREVRRYGRDFEVQTLGGAAGPMIRFEGGHLALDGLPPHSPVALAGHHAATALEAARIYLDHAVAGPLDIECACRGLSRARWPGRFDRRADLLFDGAHNPDGARWLFDTLAALGIRPRAVCFGAMADKDLAGLVAPLRALEPSVPVFGCTLDEDRAADGAQLTAALEGCDVRAVASPSEVLAAARATAPSTAGADEPILVYGSLYLVGACLEELGLTELRTTQ